MTFLKLVQKTNPELFFIFFEFRLWGSRTRQTAAPPTPSFSRLSNLSRLCRLLLHNTCTPNIQFKRLYYLCRKYKRRNCKFLSQKM